MIDRRKRRSRPGITLVEVMASLLILGTAITGIVVAQARSLRQVHSAGQQIAASRIAEELIVTWRMEAVDVTAPDSGTVTSDERWSWRRTSERRAITASAFMAEVVLVLAFEDETGAVEHEYRWLTDDRTK